MVPQKPKMEENMAESGNDSSFSFLVLEHCSNGDFVEVFKTGVFTYNEYMVRLAFKQIVKNVHYLHKVCGIVHLDLKMPNILLNAFLLPVLTDFGFAEAGNGEPLQTWKGTEYHISPEMQAFRYN